jgi:hypothetical protein
MSVRHAKGDINEDEQFLSDLKCLSELVKDLASADINNNLSNEKKCETSLKTYNLINSNIRKSYFQFEYSNNQVKLIKFYFKILIILFFN